MESQVTSQLPGMLSDWYRSILAYDPAPDWARVGAPVLGHLRRPRRPGPGRPERAGPAGGAGSGRQPGRGDRRPAGRQPSLAGVRDGRPGRSTRPCRPSSRLSSCPRSWPGSASERAWRAVRDGRTGAAGADLSWHPEPELIDVRDEAASRPALEALGAATWAAALDYLYGHAFERALGEPTRYEDMRTAFFGPSGRPAPAPDEPVATEALLAEFRDRLAPHQMNAWHPRTFGYYTPAPLWASIVGEVLAQVTNQGIDVWHCGPTGALVEEEVIAWLCGLVGYPDGAFGILTSGGTMANLMAMAVVRDVPPGAAARRRSAPARLGHRRARESTCPTRRTSRSVAGCRCWACRTRRSWRFPRTSASDCGRSRWRAPSPPTGRQATRHWPSPPPPGRRTPVRWTTCQPWPTWPSARASGSTSMPPTEGERGCRSACATRVPALERADSVTIDPQKWFFQAYDIGGLLVRDGSLLEATFSHRPEYYRGGGDPERAPDAHGSGELDFYRLGIEGTRRFRALKLWLSWKHLGTRGLGRLVERNVDVAEALARLIAASPDFEAYPAEPELSVVCFRHLPDGRDGDGPGRPRCARRPPGRAPGGARAQRPGLRHDDAPARPDLAACRHPQLHGHRVGRGAAPRGPAPPG